MPISTNQGFKSLVPKPGYDATFLYYQILALRGQFERYAVGSTFPEISKRDVARVEFDCPDDEEEQRRIGRILWSVDTQITHTEALIAKQEQVRAGLMQDLFTRGVDETGRLRLLREEAPELYHETAFGWLPRAWESSAARTMRSECDRRPLRLATLKTEHYVDEPGTLGRDVYQNIRREVTTTPIARMDLERSCSAPGGIVIAIR